MGIKKERDIKLSDYDYVMFVDASGDDGLCFESGASKTYAVACYVIPANSLDASNQDIDDIKHIIGAIPKQEVKSTTILRHKKRKEVLSFIRDLGGDLYAHISFKEKMVEHNMINLDTVKNKFFSVVCHTYPIKVFSNYYKNKRILVLIDNMKKIEQSLVQYILKTELDFVPSLPTDDLDFCFIDSKSYMYRSIQFADIFAGILREYSAEILKSGKYMKCNACIRKPGPGTLCRNPALTLPAKHDGIIAISKLLDVQHRACGIIQPASMGPGMHAGYHPKCMHYDKLSNIERLGSFPPRCTIRP